MATVWVDANTTDVSVNADKQTSAIQKCQLPRHQHQQAHRGSKNVATKVGQSGVVWSIECRIEY